MMLALDIAQIIAIVLAVEVAKDMCDNKKTSTTKTRKITYFLYERFTKQKRILQKSRKKSFADYRRSSFVQQSCDCESYGK